MNYFIKITLITVICIPNFTLAQNADIITTQFRAFSWGGKIPNIFYASKEGEEKKLNLLMQKMSDDMPYEGPANAVFYKKEGAGENLKKIPVAKFKFIRGLKRQLIVVFFDKNKIPYRTLVYPSGHNGFRNGQLKLYNFTAKQIAMKLGNEVHSVKPLGNKVLNFPSNKNSSKVEFSKLYDQTSSKQGGASKATGGYAGSNSVQLGVKGDDGWQAAFRSSWPRKLGARTHFFIFPIGTNQYRVHHLYEYPSESLMAEQQEKSANSGL